MGSNDFGILRISTAFHKKMKDWARWWSKRPIIDKMMRRRINVVEARKLFNLLRYQNRVFP